MAGRDTLLASGHEGDGMAGKRLKVFTAAAWRRWLGGGRLLGLALLVGMLVAQALDPVLLEPIRNFVFDHYQTLKPRPPSHPSPVVIVDIDEESLGEIGQWPWPRTTLARLVDRLTELGAVTVTFDFVFPEPDRMSPSVIAATLPGLDEGTAGRLREMPTNDEVFAAAMKASRVVLGQTVINTVGRDDSNRASQVSVAEIGGDPRPWLDSYPSLLGNIAVLDEAAAGHGIFNVYPELDGVVRRVPAIQQVNGKLMPSLALETLRVATGNRTLGIRTNPDLGIQSVVVRPAQVLTDRAARVWLYAGRHDPGKYVAAKDVLSGGVGSAAIAGKMVLVGTSAAGLLDIRSIAVERQIPGVEVHAQILETVLGGMQLERPADSLGVELSVGLAVGLLMIVLVPLLGARWTLILFVACAGLIAWGSWTMFAEKRLLYDPAMPIATALALYMLLTYSGYAREEAQRRQVRSAFTRYMSPALVERLAADPSHLKLGGEMRDMTLLFCDVRGFTTISEQFTAEGLTKLINAFLTPMTNVILDRRGTIDKYMGDCIMAFWNAPLDDAEHAANACESALTMNERLKDVNAKLEIEAKEEGRRHIPLAIGIGLNSGEVCVGNMGSEQRFDYSVLGDAVNLASRLEGQSKTYGVTIVIGESTRVRAPAYATLPLDLIKVKGKTEAVSVHTLLGRPERCADPTFQELAREHRAMIDSYRSQDWAAARDHLARARQADSAGELAGCHELYDERIAACEANPPGADWNGVFVATSK
ncbi:MAG: adenylate/guanylate cyclase domain-containing protein [Alphaproteobacteria bacterium]|nr:adenylate/guanylate cyclase domain-containing protein [Alphaproteobacteria bacterium]